MTSRDEWPDAARLMKLKHAVVTMVARDDLPDGGAGIVAETIRAIRRTSPGTSIEVLIWTSTAARRTSAPWSRPSPTS